MLKKIVAVVGVLVIGLFALIISRPSTFRIEREVVIAAPADVIFPLVNDFHRWVDWSPWEKRDPSMRREYSGAVSGPGAIYVWNGNDDVGSGRMTIVESRPNAFVGVRLEFFKPREATHRTNFTFRPRGDQVSVSWAMHGEHDFMGKAAGLVLNMEDLIGADFVQGLTSLKAVAEAEAAELKGGDADPPPPSEVPDTGAADVSAIDPDEAAEPSDP